MSSNLFLDKDKLRRKDPEIKKIYLLRRKVTLSSACILFFMGLFLLFWIINLDTSNPLTFFKLIYFLLILSLVVLSLVLLQSYIKYEKMMKNHINAKYFDNFPIFKITLINQNIVCGKIENIFNRSDLVLINDKKMIISKWNHIVTIEKA